MKLISIVSHSTHLMIKIQNNSLRNNTERKSTDRVCFLYKQRYDKSIFWYFLSIISIILMEDKYIQEECPVVRGLFRSDDDALRIWFSFYRSIFLVPFPAWSHNLHCDWSVLFLLLNYNSVCRFGLQFVPYDPRMICDVILLTF